ncbi:hypothetical protein D3C87_1131270 [compost metagenome]
MGAGLQSDRAAKTVRVRKRQVQHDASADRAAHDQGPVQRQGIGHRDDRLRVFLRSQLVGLLLPAFGRRRLAMPGQVEGNDPE